MQLAKHTAQWLVINIGIAFVFSATVVVQQHQFGYIDGSEIIEGMIGATLIIVAAALNIRIVATIVQHLGHLGEQLPRLLSRSRSDNEVELITNTSKRSEAGNQMALGALVESSDLQMEAGLCLICLESTGYDDTVVACVRCGTSVHEECWDFNGRCPVFGCQCSQCEANDLGDLNDELNHNSNVTL